MKKQRKAFRYFIDRAVRTGIMWVVSRLTLCARDIGVELRRQDIKRVLLVRALFRLGDSILATPAILLLRQNFPEATIDFVGPRISKQLFQNLPFDNYYEIYSSFPKVCWTYFALLKRLRHNNYDLAIDVSGSSAALGSFIVGFSGARQRAGLRGRWDRWFNIRLPRPSNPNKYANLPELIGAMGLKSLPVFPTLILSLAEAAQGAERLRSLCQSRDLPLVGVFVGGRKSRGKRWPSANFATLATLLRAENVQPIIFVGPEERETLADLQVALAHRAPVIFEPNIRKFAGLVANCTLFVTCDSGPLHLACALNVRTVGIFLNDNFDRWGPPAELAQIIFRPSGVTPEDVLLVCLDELSYVLEDIQLGKVANADKRKSALGKTTT